MNLNLFSEFSLVCIFHKLLLNTWYLLHAQEGITHIEKHEDMKKISGSQKGIKTSLGKGRYQGMFPR